MSTFFEKLTGTHPKSVSPQEPIDLTEEKEDPKRPAKRHLAKEEEEPKPHRVKIESEESSILGKEELPQEDEGELTVDIYDKGEAIVIQSTVAGVKPEDLDISITNDTVTIRGRRERQEEISEEHYYYKELFWGTFSRSVILPEEIEEDLAEATFKHGLLTIRLPKKKRGVVQKVKVKVT